MRELKNNKNTQCISYSQRQICPVKGMLPFSHNDMRLFFVGVGVKALDKKKERSTELVFF